MDTRQSVALYTFLMMYCLRQGMDVDMNWLKKALVLSTLSVAASFGSAMSVTAVHPTMPPEIIQNVYVGLPGNTEALRFSSDGSVMAAGTCEAISIFRTK